MFDLLKWLAALAVATVIMFSVLSATLWFLMYRLAWLIRLC